MIKILITDDDPKHRDSLGDVVDSFGYAVDFAQNCEEAKTVITSRGPFHAVLLDYMFGPQQKTGLEALGDLRQLLPVDEVPILLMTGYATLDVAVRALRQGLSDFLIKPVDPTYLKHTLEKNLEKARLLAENKRLMAELKISNEQLARLSELKSKFLSFCAHDLSNTVSGTTMSADLLVRSLGKAQNAQQERLIAILQDSIGQTQRLITDLVDYSSIEKGKFKIEKKQESLSNLIQAPIISIVQEKAKAKNVVLKTSFPKETDVVLDIDLRRLLQVLGNLMENALRYTPSGGTLEFALRRDESERSIVFSVKDSGEGIDPEDREHLFESFYQGKDASKRGRLGLGLSIAKEIVEGHGGKIWVESEGTGKGSAFSFKIPL